LTYKKNLLIFYATISLLGFSKTNNYHRLNLLYLYFNQSKIKPYEVFRQTDFITNTLGRKFKKMSIEQIDKIDFISTTSEGKVELTISDHLEWDFEKNHLLVLQNKINAYLDFVKSGQILEDYPSAQNKEITISVVMKYAPEEDALIFLNHCEKFMKKQGLEFKWEVVEE
jgi:hypothetical protein